MTRYTLPLHTGGPLMVISTRYTAFTYRYTMGHYGDMTRYTLPLHTGGPLGDMTSVYTAFTYQYTMGH